MVITPAAAEDDTALEVIAPAKLTAVMQAWTTNTTVSPIRYNPEIDGRDYEFVTAEISTPKPTPEPTPIPGFSTIVIPVMAFIGSMLIMTRRK